MKIGQRVRSKVDFSGVPKGTEGIIDFDYGTGFMVAWDLKDRPLPKNYKMWNGEPAVKPGMPLRDGFDKRSEMNLLEFLEFL